MEAAKCFFSGGIIFLAAKWNFPVFTFHVIIINWLVTCCQPVRLQSRDKRWYMLLFIHFSLSYYLDLKVNIIIRQTGRLVIKSEEVRISSKLSRADIKNHGKNGARTRRHVSLKKNHKANSKAALFSVAFQGKEKEGGRKGGRQNDLVRKLFLLVKPDNKTSVRGSVKARRGKQYIIDGLYRNCSMLGCCNKKKWDKNDSRTPQKLFKIFTSIPCLNHFKCWESRHDEWPIHNRSSNRCFSLSFGVVSKPTWSFHTHTHTSFYFYNFLSKLIFIYLMFRKKYT